MPFTAAIDFGRINFFAIPPALVGGLVFLLGFITLFSERRRRISGSFFLLTSSVALWLLSYGVLFLVPNPAPALILTLSKLAHMGVSFIPSFTMLFVSFVVRSSPEFRKWVMTSIGLSTLFCLINLKTDFWFQDTAHYFWGFYPLYKPFSYSFLLFFFSALFSSLLVLWQGYRQAQSKRAKGRLQALLVAFSISCFASVDYLASYGIQVYPGGYLPILIFIVLIVDTMHRYHLSDVTPAFASEKILETMQGIVLVLDLDGIIRVANLAACESLSYEKSELLGLPIKQVISVVENPGLSGELPLVQSLLEKQNSVIRGQPMRWVAKNGALLNLSVSVSVIRGRADDKEDGIVYVAQDLAERQRAEQALQEIEDRFQMVIENVQDYAIYVLDSRGNVETWNLGAERIKGYNAEQIIGSHFSRFYTEEDIKNNQPQQELEGAAEYGSVENEGWRVRMDGTRFLAHSTITALKNKSGKLQGFLKITRDITKVKEAEEVLRHRKDLEMKANFISIVSHELRTPLTVISMGVDILRKGEAGELSPQQIEWVDMCSRNVGRLTRLISKVLDFQKLESRRMEYEMEEIDLNQLIREEEKSIRLLLTGKTVDLKLELASDLPRLKLDRDKITEVITNILDNAVKFTTAGSITIKTENLDGKVRLTICDTGIGIRREDIPKLFSSFTQVHGAVHRTGGTGLGLAISKKIIEQQDGQIQVESEVGVGTTFLIEFPI